MDESIHKSDQVEIHDKHKWTGQQVGVNSNIPLVDEGKGKPYILRQFEFTFNPEMLRKIKEKKVPAPTRQELFNSNVKQMRVMLWSDGLVPREDLEPRMTIGKKKYRIFLLCEPKFRAMVADKPQTLQEIAPAKRLT